MDRCQELIHVELQATGNLVSGEAELALILLDRSSIYLKT